MGFVKVCSMFFLSFAKQNQAEVWPRFKSLLKLLLWNEIVEWIKVLGSWCLGQCLKSMKENQFFPVGGRLEICHDCYDQRSCKKCPSCVNFFRKQQISLQNLHRNMKYYFLVSLHIHFLPKYWKFTFFVNFNKKKGTKSFIFKITLFYRVQKLSRFARFWCVKFFGRKFRRVNFLTNFNCGWWCPIKSGLLEK